MSTCLLLAMHTCLTLCTLPSITASMSAVLFLLCTFLLFAMHKCLTSCKCLTLCLLCCVPLQDLLGEVKGHMSTFLPAYKVNEVAVSLWALARLKGQPGLRLMAAALQHCFSQVSLWAACAVFFVWKGFPPQVCCCCSFAVWQAVIAWNALGNSVPLPYRAMLCCAVVSLYLRDLP